MSILAAADQSGHDLARRLRRGGFDADTAEAAVARMREHGYVDDTAFAESIVARRLRQGYGWQRIRQDLGARGLPAEREAVTDERESAQALAERLWSRRRGDDLQRDRARVARTLERRGFAAETIAQALRTCLDDVPR